MSNKIKLRRGTAAVWTSTNPILAAGEQGFETDTGKLKIGDGTTVWTSLAYLADPAGTSAAETTRALAAEATKLNTPAGATAQDLVIIGAGGTSSRVPVGTAGQSPVVRSDGTVGYIDHEINLMGWKIQYPNLGNGTSASDDTNAIQAWANAVIAAGTRGVAPVPTGSNYLLNRTIFLTPPAGSTSCAFSMDWYGGKYVKWFGGGGTDAHRSVMFYCAGWKEGTHVRGLSGGAISAPYLVFMEIDNAATTVTSTYASGQIAGTFINVADSQLLQAGQTLTLSVNTANSETLTIATVPTTTLTGAPTITTTPSNVAVGSTTGWPTTGNFYASGVLVSYTSIVDSVTIGGATVASGSLVGVSGGTIKANSVTVTGATTKTHTSGDIVCSNFLSFSQLTIEDSFFYANAQAGLVGWRLAHSDNQNNITQSDFSFIGWRNCGFDAAGSGNTDSNAQEGWAFEGDNVLTNFIDGGFSYGADKVITTNPTTGSSRTSTQTRASITVRGGFGTSGTRYTDYEITGYGALKVAGGRYERGAGRFAIIGASTSSTLPIVASFTGVEIADYAGKGGENTGGELITVQGASSLVLEAMDIQTTNTINSHNQWGTNMIAATNTASVAGAILVRDSILCAANPFIAASGLYLIRTPGNLQASTPWPATIVGAFPDIMASWAACAVPVVRGKSFYYMGGASVATTNNSGNGLLRLAAMYLPQPITIDQLQTEFTVAGDAASILATCIYADNGIGYPGSLIVVGPTISTGTGNAGTVATGGTPGMYSGALQSGSVVSAGIATLPSGLYWIGGVVQGVTVTQPTIRTRDWGVSQGGALAAWGTSGQEFNDYGQSSVTGALPSTFTASVSAQWTGAPGVGFRVP